MPLYAYRCEDCDNRFETLVRSGETPECPSCASTHLDRQLSLIAKPAPGGWTTLWRDAERTARDTVETVLADSVLDDGSSIPLPTGVGR